MSANPGSVSVVHWVIGSKVYDCAVEQGTCSECGAVNTVTILPAPLRAAQPDDTTHVCLEGLGGCNYGFAFDGSAAPEAREALRSAVVVQP